jgi:hypothetical protein
VNAENLPEMDKDGNPRVVNVFDIGAYEFQDTSRITP